MKKVKKLRSLKMYQKAAEVLRMGNEAVVEAIKENKKKGVPTVFSIKGKIFYEMPDGSIVAKT